MAVSLHAREHPTEIAVLASSPSMVHWYVPDSTGMLASADSLLLSSTQEQIVCTGVDKDGHEEYVASRAKEGSALLITGAPGYRTIRSMNTVRAEQMLAADIDGDSRLDLLLFGHSTLGVGTLLHTPSGGFIDGPTLFPDVSVSDLSVLDINGDGIPDVVLLDWLNNQVHIYYGITGAVFSEQLSIPLQGEPARLAVWCPANRAFVRIGITMPEEQRISILDVAVFEETSLIASIRCPSAPRGIAFAFVGPGQEPGIISSTTEGLWAIPSEGMKAYAEPVVLGVARSSTLWCVADVNRDGRPDLVAVDPVARKLILVYSHSPQSQSQTLTYAVGFEPRGITLTNLGGNTSPDIAVASAGSSVVSVLFTGSGGEVMGQFSSHLEGRPEGITPVHGLQRVALAVSLPASNSISVVEFSSDPMHASTFSIPAPPHPQIVDAWATHDRRRIEILATSERSRSRTASVSQFSQMGRHQFIEHSIRLSVSHPLQALAATRSQDNGYLLLFSVGGGNTQMSSLYLARSSRGFSFRDANRLCSYADSGSMSRSLTWGRSTASESDRALLFVGPPRNAAGLVQIAPDEDTASVSWIEDIRLADDEDVLFADVDCDGFPDLLYHDAATGGLTLLRGTTEGLFSQREHVDGTDGVGGFAVGPILRSTTNDLVISRTAEAVVQILRNPFQRATRQ